MATTPELPTRITPDPDDLPVEPDEGPDAPSEPDDPANPLSPEHPRR